MLLVQNKKAVVLSTKRYEEIAALLPKAVPMNLRGKNLVAVRHAPAETQVLRNMGFTAVPSPILYHYDWPGRFTPMEHQRQTAAFFTLNRRCICLNAPGTGKSLSALWAADYLLSAGEIKRALIVAPLSTVKPVWANEIYQHMMHRRFALVRGTRDKRKAILEDESNEICVINHDGFTSSKKFMPKFDLVIYDEATALKNPSTVRYRSMYDYCAKHMPWLWLMTGTPVSQQPTDAWTLAKLVGSPTLPNSYNRFKDMVMRRVTTFRWEPKPDALDICKRVLVPSIRYQLDECKDIPDTVYVDRQAELTPAQKAAYKQMQEEAAIAGSNISAPNAAVMLNKLLQICCGVVYDADSNPVAFDDTSRYQTLKESLEEIGGKVIVFVPFRAVQEHLRKLLAKDKYDVEVVNGSVTGKERDDIFYRFQHTDSVQVLLAHPKVAAHGLTLTRSSAIIWYAPVYSLEQYEQANARIRRLSTKGKTLVQHLYATSFESTLYTRLRNKQKVLTDFLSLVKGVNE